METNYLGKILKMLAAAALIAAVFAGCSAGTTGTAGTGNGAASSGTSGEPLKDAQASVFQDVTGGGAKSLIASTANMTILDVRTPEEYATGHLENALNIDYKAASFRNEIGKLDKNKPYLVYCRSGKRAAESVKIMNELGFTDVKNLAGGILQWQAEGGEIISN